MSILARSEFWALLGVVLGFGLNALWQILRDGMGRRRRTRSIEAELRTNLGLLPQKIKHLQNAQRALDNRKLLAGDSVHFATYLYDTHIGEVAQHLSSTQREVLHVVYQSMRVVDTFLDDLVSDFVQKRSSGQLAKPFKAYAGMCAEMADRCRLVSTMISEYLAGEPREVTWDNIAARQ